MEYLILKWVHVLLAITALGANITYGIWLGRAARDPQHLAFALRGVKILDDRIANPAYGLLLISGVALTIMSGIPFSTPWITAAVVLYVAVLLLTIFGYTPMLRRQVELAEQGATSTPEYGTTSRSATMLGIVMAILVVLITYLMVVKPPLWAI